MVTGGGAGGVGQQVFGGELFRHFVEQLRQIGIACALAVGAAGLFGHARQHPGIEFIADPDGVDGHVAAGRARQCDDAVGGLDGIGVLTVTEHQHRRAAVGQGLCHLHRGIDRIVQAGCPDGDDVGALKLAFGAIQVVGQVHDLVDIIAKGEHRRLVAAIQAVDKTDRCLFRLAQALAAHAAAGIEHQDDIDGQGAGKFRAGEFHRLLILEHFEITLAQIGDWFQAAVEGRYAHLHGVEFTVFVGDHLHGMHGEGIGGVGQHRRDDGQHKRDQQNQGDGVLIFGHGSSETLLPGLAFFCEFLIQSILSGRDTM